MIYRARARGAVGLAAALFGLCLALAGAARATDDGPAGALSLHRLEWLRGGEAGPVDAPTADADAAAPSTGNWVPFNLPLRWSTAPGSGLEPLHMRLRFPLPAAPAETWGVLIDDSTEGARVLVNGRMVGEIPSASEQRAVAWRQPHLFALDPAVLVAGDNDIELEGAVRPGAHMVGEISVGPWPQLWNNYAQEFFSDYLWVWVGLTIAFVVGLATLAIPLIRGMPGASLLSLASAAWVVHAAALLFEVVPANAAALVRFADLLGLSGFVAAVVASLLSQCAVTRRAYVLLALSLTVTGPALLLLSGGGGLGVSHAWRLALALTVAGVVGISLVRRGAGRPAPGGIALAVGVLIALSLLIDAGTALGLAQGIESNLTGVAAPMVLAALSAPIAEGVSRLLREAENSRDELEVRVRERGELLKRNYDRLRESEHLKVEAKERQRIMQDMHDGLGSQLLSALMLVERQAVSSDQFAQILRESIDDMRLAIDALAAEEADLGAALGNLRFRMEPRLRAAGIELQWDTRRLSEDLALLPDAVLPILRIVQEALTNAIKHSRAKLVRVAVIVETVNVKPKAQPDQQEADPVEETWLDIRISDNGCGISGERIGGRGLLNMRNRAQKISAQLRLETARDKGTSVHLRYKVVRAEAEPSSNTVLNTQAVIERIRQT